MKALLAPNSCGAALAFPKATAIRSYQHQMFDHGSAGAIALGVRHGQAPAVVYDKTQDRRLGRGDATPVLSHCRSAAGISPHSRRPVLETLPGIGLHFPAERIRAARGAFHSVRVSACKPVCAQSLANQHLHKLAVAKIHHLTNRLSSSAVSVGIDPNENGLTHEARSLSPDDKIHD